MEECKLCWRIGDAFGRCRLGWRRPCVWLQPVDTNAHGCIVDANSRWFRVRNSWDFYLGTHRKSEYSSYDVSDVSSHDRSDTQWTWSRKFHHFYRLSSGSCLGDPSLANRPLLIRNITWCCRFGTIVVTLQLLSVLKNLSEKTRCGDVPLAYGQLAGERWQTNSPWSCVVGCLNFWAGEKFKPSPRTM